MIQIHFCLRFFPSWESKIYFTRIVFHMTMRCRPRSVSSLRFHGCFCAAKADKRTPRGPDQGFSSKIRLTRPTRPSSSITLIPCGWAGLLVKIRPTTPRVSFPVGWSAFCTISTVIPGLRSALRCPSKLHSPLPGSFPPQPEKGPGFFRLIIPFSPRQYKAVPTFFCHPR